MGKNNVNNSAPKSQNKTHQIHFRCTQNDYKLIKELANKQNLNMSKYILSKSLDKTFYVVDHSKELISLYSKIQKIGNNLNQIATQLNTYKSNNSFFKAHKDIEKMMDEYVNTMTTIEKVVLNKLSE